MGRLFTFDDERIDDRGNSSVGMKGKIDRSKSLAYMLAGNSYFTVKNEETGNRFTYHVTDVHVVDKDAKANLWFVKVLTGADNTSNYTYLGCIRKQNDKLYYEHGRKSNVGVEAQSVKVINWLVRKLSQNGLPEQISLYHEGRCGRCGRKLTVPESVTSGYGPECITKMM